jgi:hypothetical protein
MADQIQEKLNRRIVGQGEDFGQGLARPVFVQHLLFGDENDVAALSLQFAHKISAFEKGGEADYVEWP